MTGGEWQVMSDERRVKSETRLNSSHWPHGFARLPILWKQRIKGEPARCIFGC